jgi:hypothetical protein
MFVLTEQGGKAMEGMGCGVRVTTANVTTVPAH